LAVLVLDKTALAAAAPGLSSTSCLEITVSDESTLTLTCTVNGSAICLLILVLDESALGSVGHCISG
jgi:hypothetical protein